MLVMKRYFPILLLFICSCEFNRSTHEIERVQGYTPVYASRDVINKISTEIPRPTAKSGKIYAYGAFLFQVEQNEGIHIIDNRPSAQAKKIAFLKVPMASELSIKSDHLYTNNLNDLVVFDLSDATAPRLVNRIKDAFPVIDQMNPPFTNTAFECADPAKGIVVGWVLKMLDKPKCRR